MPFSALTIAITAIGGGSAFTANMLALAMVDQINLKLPEKEHNLYGRGTSRSDGNTSGFIRRAN
jgi:hypothetical protein